MRRRLQSLIAATFFLACSFITLLPQHAAATQINGLIVTLAGASDASGYTVTAKEPTVPGTITFTYNDGKYDSSEIAVPGEGSTCDNSSSGKADWEITISAKKGSSVGATTYNACDPNGTNSPDNPGFFPVSLSVASGSGNTNDGTVKGSVHYTDAAGKTQPFDGTVSTTNITLLDKSSNKEYDLTMDKNGNITGPGILNGDLPADGDSYEFAATTQPANAQSESYYAAFTLSAKNKVEVINGTGQAGAGAGDNQNKANQASDAAAAAAAAAANPDNSAPQLSCHAGFNPLNWLVCGVIDGLTKIINSVDSFISSQLSINTSQIFSVDSKCSQASNSGSDCTGYAYYKAWSSFRDIALGLMVVAGLVVIISQALGFEILDAYTIRKVLPRLVVAAIAITVSWSLMQFFVGLTNDLGYGVRSLIYAPFSSLGSDAVSLGGQHLSASSIGTSFGVTLATGAAITALGIFGLLSFVGTAALAVFVAFLVLVIRQILITVLILLAPIAIVAYILPNTNKIYKIWWDSFAKALMMFPIISGFIAAGRVMSLVADKNTTDPFSQFIAFAAYFAPYFLLPLTFRFAGGALSNIGGFVNDRHKGAFDRLRNFRGNEMKKNSAAMKSGTRFEGSKYAPGSRSLANAFNKSSVAAGTGVKGRFGMGVRGAAAVDQARRRAAGDLHKDPNQVAIKDDDNALRAQTYKNDSAALTGVRDHLLTQKDENGNFKYTNATATAEANRAVKAVQAATGFGGVQAITAAEQMVQTGTAIENIQDQAQIIARASNGNASTISALAGNANAVNKQVGRHDLAPSFGTLNSLAQQEAIAPGTVSADAYGAAQEKAWRSGSLYQHANDKPQNIDAAIKHYSEMLNTSTDPAKQEEAAVFFNELKAMAPNASGEVKARVDKALDSHQVRLSEVVQSLGSTPLTVTNSAGTTVAAPTNKTQTQEVQVLDPATGNYYTERQVVATHAESAAERVDRHTRSYERIDPNRM
jgi:hypothetical protein